MSLDIPGQPSEAVLQRYSVPLEEARLFFGAQVMHLPQTAHCAH